MTGYNLAISAAQPLVTDLSHVEYHRGLYSWTILISLTHMYVCMNDPPDA